MGPPHNVFTSNEQFEAHYNSIKSHLPLRLIGESTLGNQVFDSGMRPVTRPNTRSRSIASTVGFSKRNELTETFIAARNKWKKVKTKMTIAALFSRRPITMFQPADDESTEPNGKMSFRQSRSRRGSIVEVLDSLKTAAESRASECSTSRKSQALERLSHVAAKDRMIRPTRDEHGMRLVIHSRSGQCQSLQMDMLPSRLLIEDRSLYIKASQAAKEEKIEHSKSPTSELCGQEEQLVSENQNQAKSVLELSVAITPVKQTFRTVLRDSFSPLPKRNMDDLNRCHIVRRSTSLVPLVHRCGREQQVPEYCGKHRCDREQQVSLPEYCGKQDGLPNQCEKMLLVSKPGFNSSKSIKAGECSRARIEGIKAEPRTAIAAIRSNRNEEQMSKVKVEFAPTVLESSHCTSALKQPKYRRAVKGSKRELGSKSRRNHCSKFQSSKSTEALNDFEGAMQIRHIDC